MAKALSVIYEGVNIRAENHWFKGLLLYVNDNLVSMNKQLLSISAKTPLISVLYDFPNGKKRIDVYCEVIIVTKIKICIDGNFVAGDQIGQIDF